MNVYPYNTTDYENISDWTLGQNKPNSNPIKANFQNAQMNVNSLMTKDYRKNDDFAAQKNKPNSNPISVKPKMNANLFFTKDYENETTFRLQKNKSNQSQFHLPQRHALSYAEGGKTEVQCRMSEVRYLSSAFCFLSSFHVHLLVNRLKPKLLNFYLKNHRALAVGFSGFINVNSALCLFYHFNCLGYLVQLWDLEKFATLAAVYPSVSGTTIKQPSTATFRALGDNLHPYIPYAKSRILKRSTFQNQFKPRIFYLRSR